MSIQAKIERNSQVTLDGDANASNEDESAEKLREA